ncbi:hypothetical protein MTR67_039206 [Solanum verrucosum]|uniref:Uncharacterized protein n=1 Tax=Solanum verrucosum TaxID=315347 RepID=A0AAF0UHX3_SOLVR|nr:hypothetical protein MTR67_039206 [Solanum verrucosum]
MKISSLRLVPECRALSGTTPCSLLEASGLIPRPVVEFDYKRHLGVGPTLSRNDLSFDLSDSKCWVFEWIVGFLWSVWRSMKINVLRPGFTVYFWLLEGLSGGVGHPCRPYHNILVDSTDDQSESTIQVLVDMLRVCVMDFRGVVVVRLVGLSLQSLGQYDAVELYDRLTYIEEPVASIDRVVRPLRSRANPMVKAASMVGMSPEAFGVTLGPFCVLAYEILLKADFGQHAWMKISSVRLVLESRVWSRTILRSLPEAFDLIPRPVVEFG